MNSRHANNDSVVYRSIEVHIDDDWDKQLTDRNKFEKTTKPSSITKENEKSVDLNRFKYNNSLNTAVPQKQRHNQLVALDQINNVEDILSGTNNIFIILGNKNNILSVTANPSFKNRSFVSNLKPQKSNSLRIPNF